jgi:hypothetical protein
MFSECTVRLESLDVSVNSFRVSSRVVSGVDSNVSNLYSASVISVSEKFASILKTET